MKLDGDLEMSGKYINPFTDFGFKRLFGEEANKDILMDFLNEILHEEQGKIKDIIFKKTEQLGRQIVDRKAIFDIFCESENGEKFIVEMQKAKHDFFKDRSVFYSTFPIREQAERGDWNYELKAVYTVAILDFVFDEDKQDQEKMIYRVKLSDIETNKVFYDKLNFIYIEMPKFKKTLEECENHFDRWLYVLRNLEKFDNYPDSLQEKIFKKLFGEAEIAGLKPSELEAYDESLKVYRDMKGCIDTAHSEGYKEAVKSMERKIQEAEEREMKESEARKQAEDREMKESEARKQAEEREMKAKADNEKMLKAVAEQLGISIEEVRKILS